MYSIEMQMCALPLMYFLIVIWVMSFFLKEFYLCRRRFQRENSLRLKPPVTRSYFKVLLLELRGGGWLYCDNLSEEKDKRVMWEIQDYMWQTARDGQMHKKSLFIMSHLTKLVKGNSISVFTHPLLQLNPLKSCCIAERMCNFWTLSPILPPALSLSL